RPLVPHAAIDDQVDAVKDRLGEASGGALALLVAIVERGVGTPAVGGEVIEPNRRIDEAPAGEAELLIVAGYREEGFQVGRGVVEVADAVTLVERVVDAVAVGFESIAIERARPRPVIG